MIEIGGGSCYFQPQKYLDGQKPEIFLERSEARDVCEYSGLWLSRAGTDAAHDVTDEEDDNQDSFEDLAEDNEICGHSLSTSHCFWTKDQTDNCHLFTTVLVLIYYQYSSGEIIKNKIEISH